MQYRVPQKIDMEDKIIGPLTMKQFVYLLVGGMITYATIKSFNYVLIIFVGVPVGVLALALAFVKIQDQPFTKFLTSLAFYFIRPKKRYWYKDWQKQAISSSVVQKEVPKEKKEQSKIVQKSELEKLSNILDTKGAEKIDQFQKKEGVDPHKNANQIPVNK